MNILGKLGRERHIISLTKVMYKKIKANKILNDVTPNYFLLRSLNTFSLEEQGKDYPPSPLTLYKELPTSVVRKGKEINGIGIGKKK